MNPHAPLPMPLPGQEPPVQDPDPFAPPPPVDEPGTPLPRREPPDPAEESDLEFAP